MSRSRILGSSKDYEECEPLTWWEYIFGQSGAECHDDLMATVEAIDKYNYTEIITSANQTALFGSITAVNQLALPPGESNCVLGLANRILISA